MTKMKSVYLNGKLVGEAAATGDLEADQWAALQVLKDTGNYRKPSLVDGMFRQALSFATTSAYLYERDLLKVPRNGLSVAPFVVNSALAIELYLKTLGQLYSVKLRGHDLLTLFDKLPPEAVDALRANFEKSSRRCEIRTIADYREALAALRLAFVEWRYVYEKERSSTITFEPLIFVMQMLHEACRARMKTGAAHP